MNSYDKWTLDTIRSEGVCASWLEEIRLEWMPITAHAINQILEGKTVVIVTDYDRKWLADYVISSINRKKHDRPIIPVIKLDQFYPHFDYSMQNDSVEMLEDMLDISFSSRYFFWYIGRGDDRNADIIKRGHGSYMWIMDESFPNAISLRSYDEQIDMKLIQLFRLFNLTLNSALYGEIDVNN